MPRLLPNPLSDDMKLKNWYPSKRAEKRAKKQLKEWQDRYRLEICIECGYRSKVHDTRRFVTSCKDGIYPMTYLQL